MDAFQEKVCEFTEDQLGFIKYVLCPAFPLNCWPSVVNNPQHVYTHEFVARNPEKSRSAGAIVSSHYPAALDLFKTCCAQMGVEVRTIYRMAINSTGFSLTKHGEPHVDHKFEHKSFLLYLNDFTGGPTYLMDEEKNITHQIEAVKHKAATWDGRMHAQGFCGNDERRVVFVVTYD